MNVKGVGKVCVKVTCVLCVWEYLYIVYVQSTTGVTNDMFISGKLYN